MKRQAIICDIDGTILDIRHRLHWVKGEDTNWEEFLKPENILKDNPIRMTIEIIRSLNRKYPIIFVTGRNEGIRDITVKQIQRHCNLAEFYMFMREDGDHRADTEIKSELYHKYVEPRYDVLCVFDDKTSVVNLWRSLGLLTYQIDPVEYDDGF